MNDVANVAMLVILAGLTFALDMLRPTLRRR